MKKILAIVLCLAMCIGVFAMTASAAGGYYVAGTAELCGVAWDPGAAANKMTANSDGTYSITYKNVPAGSYEFKVTDGTWDNSWGSNGNNYVLSLDKTCDVTITFDPDSCTITVDAAGKNTYKITNLSIIGTGAADMGNWDTDLAMTEVSAKVYNYTFENLSNVTLEFKFRANNEWTVNFGGSYEGSGVESAAYQAGNNIKVEVTDASKVSIELDMTNYDVETAQGATFTITITPVQAGSGEGDSNEGGSSNAGEDDSTVPGQDDAAVPGEGGSSDPDTITVHAKVPSDWAGASAYIWDGNGTDNTWPGAQMTLGSDGWYTVELPAWGNNIIINCGSNEKQTQDISITAGKDLWIVVEADGYGFTGTVSYETPKTGDATNLIALGAAMVLAATGVVAITVSKKKFF